MSDLTPITREETFLNGDTELTPITREEKILAGEDLDVVTRREWFLKKYRNSGGDISVEPITITENGTTTAPQGTAYSPIIVDVPQTQPTLITKSITDNGTYNASDDNADGYSQVTVDVPPVYVKEVPNLPASIASFNDGAVGNLADLKISVEPVQDLHGYDSPWVGGAGKNKFDSDTVLSAFTKNNNKYVGMPSFVVDNYVISGGFKTNTRYTLSYKAYNNTSTPSNFRFVFSYTDETEEIIGGFVDTTTEKVIVGTSAENKTISKIKRNYGNGVKLTLYDIQLEEGSTATTFAPYSNICPISGHTEANVTRCGVNVWDEEWEHKKGYSSGSMLSSDTNIASKNYISCKPSTAYYFKIPSTLQIYLYQYDSNKDFIKANAVNSSESLTTESNTAFLKFASKNDGYSGDYNNDISINYPSTDTSYHAYNGHTYTIDLDGTRYGGTLDVVSGVLTVDRVSVDLGSITVEWGYNANGNRFTNGGFVSVIASPSTDSDVAVADSSALKVMSLNAFKASSDDALIAVGDSGIISVRLTSCGTDTTAIKTALTGVQFVYKLATPLTIQLTPTQVTSLLADNNIYADCGQVVRCVYPCTI